MLSLSRIRKCIIVPLGAGVDAFEILFHQNLEGSAGRNFLPGIDCDLLGICPSSYLLRWQQDCKVRAIELDGRSGDQR